MRRWLLVAVVVAAVMGVAFYPRPGCKNLPEFSILVDGAAPSPRQVSGNGQFCGAIGDGAPVSRLDPVVVRPGAEVTMIYDTPVRWDRVDYTVRRDDTVISQGRLWGKRDTFALPDVPGTYQVVINNRWNGWLSGAHAEGATYFQVRVGP